ncbi:transcriptional regulator [Enterococcus silesiacus]|uniref:Transcriptional regulator n=1 Tax=Enterococcus silesiacus TaxID=332949 RepID=A0A0S3K9P9_9ENTE|nr:AsnC family transcriptional regulator [Enterococcus silesiacus]ALS01004.1 transcriptional regulator [Enterococcus silesiacus]OJG91771.1 AsnC family transcriptional regulator [Enterococcus silesiacus]
MDDLDQQIVQLLTKNAKLTNKEIGAIVHLTGQAVSQRITYLKDNGIIENYTITIKHAEKQFIRIFMENNQFSAIESMINRFEEIDTFYKVSGHACYLVVAHFNQKRLKEFIEVVSKWARCSVDSVVRNAKK